jgi:N utilization substance protein A
VQFVTNAISPAKVQRVSIVDDAERVMEVIVEDKQLSLAIGKKGQNVRLAAKLTGWKIDIKSEEEKRKEVEAQLEGLDFTAPAAELVLPGIHDEVVTTLKQAGYDTTEKILGASVEQLAELEGFDAETVEAVIASARESQGSTEVSADTAEQPTGTVAPADEERAAQEHEEVK